MSEEPKPRKRMPKRMYPLKPRTRGTLQRPDVRDEEEQGLKEEIAMLRDLNRRVTSQAEKGNLPEDLIRLLEALGKSSTRLATLLKADRMLSGEEDEVKEALNQALTEVLQEIEEENRLRALADGNKA